MTMSNGAGSLAVTIPQSANYPPATSQGIVAKTTRGSWKEAVDVASTATIPNLSSVLLSNFDGAGQGFALTLGSRVLVKNTASPNGVLPASAVYNGLYVVTAIAADGLHGTLTYDLDGNTSACYGAGQVVPVAGGSLAGSLWMLTTPNPIVLGTTALTYAAPTLG